MGRLALSKHFPQLSHSYGKITLNYFLSFKDEETEAQRHQGKSPAYKWQDQVLKSRIQSLLGVH